MWVTARRELSTRTVGDDHLWGVNHRKKGAVNTLAALKSIRAARPDGAPIYVIAASWKGPVPAPKPKSSPIPPRSSDSDVTAEPRFSAETAIAKSAVVRLAQSGYRTGRTLLVVAVTGAAPACR